MGNCTCVTSGELGVALSGGGARGLAQLGVLKVLDRESVPVSYVAGTSAGAIVGAVYVTSRDAKEAEERALAHLRTSGIGFNTETFAMLRRQGASHRIRLLSLGRTLWRATRGASGLIGGEAMRASLHRLLGDATFEDARLPFATTALDLSSGRRVIFAAGSLVDAVYASSAIPGLFEPLTLDDHVLVDGGWAEPIPVDSCHHLGAIHILAVDVPAEASTVQEGAVSTALRADTMARWLLEESQLGAADFVVRPRARVAHFADFSNAPGLIAAGEQAAESALDDIRAVLERHRALFVRGPARRGARSRCDPPTGEAAESQIIGPLVLPDRPQSPPVARG